MLQVSGGCLGHKVDACKSPKKVTFYEDEKFGVEGGEYCAKSQIS